MSPIKDKNKTRVHPCIRKMIELVTTKSQSFSATASFNLCFYGRQVHQIARSFRDRYIPWHARRVNRVERDTERMEFQQTSNPRSFPLQHSLERKPSEDNSVKQSVTGPKLPVEGSSVSCVSSCADGTRVRKRKSRWDEPGDIEYPSKKDFRSKFSGNEQHENMDVDAPPGFSSPVNRQLSQSNPSPPSTVSQRCKTVMGQPQDRYISRLPTSFGVPCSLLKKIGTPDDKGEGAAAAAASWIVAPAMTFHPFPPLPVYPRGDNPHVKEEQSWRNCNFQRDRNPNTLGQRYFKQQKWNNLRSGGHQWNHSKYGPAGFNGPNQSQPNIGVGYGENDANGSYNTGFCQQQQLQPHH